MIRPSRPGLSPADPRIDFNNAMAEFYDYGAGFNLTGRLIANITKELTPQQFAPYEISLEA